ncbi:hypothetical protein D1AOALGA4SA_11285 [Olavius algarvensis Delta 1 endosymbiont]|nr:hypothetical protein D1AOALGA4SA_11285 [Olavius algarvensis Delta 1 endosymbiont]
MSNDEWRMSNYGILSILINANSNRSTLTICNPILTILLLSSATSR